MYTYTNVYMHVNMCSVCVCICVLTKYPVYRNALNKKAIIFSKAPTSI